MSRSHAAERNELLGARIQPFEACSGFARVAARTLAGPPEADLCPRSFDGSVTLAIAQGSYQGVPTPPRTGLSPAALIHLSRRTLKIVDTARKTRSVFERYNIVSHGDLREAVRTLDRKLG